MKTIRFLAIILIVFAMSALAAEREKKTFVATIDSDGVQRVEVVGGSYYFEPYRIVVKVGVPVELKVRKDSIIPHDIVIEAPEAGIKIKEELKKEPKIIKFTPTATGTYPIYCSKKPPFFKSHRERGMEGVLEIVK